jgi:diguanylate cyclase (GGDEF)-like protein/PAS domain S-box-containing protein
MRSLNDVQTLGQFVRNLREGVYITTAAGTILDANPAFLEMFGVASLAELQPHSAASLLVDPARRAEETRILEAAGSVREFELEIRRPDGGTRTVLDTAHRVLDSQTAEVLYHGILVDITDRKVLERQLRELTTRDALTGCYNRRFLDETLGRLDGSDGAFAVIVVDIDRFKDTNDRLGHDAGDRLLVQLGRFLCRQVRVEDPVIRIGGDEFAVLLPGLTTAATLEVVERLRRTGPDAAPVSFTVGWAVREQGEAVTETLRRADQGLIGVRVEERFVQPRGSLPSLT